MRVDVKEDDRGTVFMLSVHLEDPAKLCETFAENLTQLHSLKSADCPTENGLEDMVRRAEDNFRKGRCDLSLLRYLDCADPAVAFDELTAIFRHVGWDREVAIHSDYCLPNVMLHHWRLSWPVIDMHTVGNAFIDTLILKKNYSCT